MATKLLKQSKDEVIFLIKIDAQTFERALIEEYRKATALEGTNTAPSILSNKALLEKYPQLRVITKEAIDKLMETYYMSAIKELKIKPAGLPMIRPEEAAPGSPCVIKVQVALEPELELIQFEGLEVNYTPVIVTEEDIQQQIENLHQQYGTKNDETQLLNKLGFGSDQTLKEEVGNALTQMAAEKTEYNREQAVSKKLIEANPFDIHLSIVEQQVFIEIQQLQREMGQQALENHLKTTGKSINDLQREIRPLAEASAKKNFILIALTKKMSPEVTDADIKEAVCRQRETLRDSDEEYEIFRKHLNGIPGAIEQIKQSIRLEKVLQHIYDKAIFKENDSKRIMTELPGIQVTKK